MTTTTARTARKGFTLADARREFWKHPSPWMIGVALVVALIARISVGEQPSTVTCSRSHSVQSRSTGQSGAPSMKTSVAPTAPPPTTVHGPMIQPMSVENRIVSPGRASAW